jgi:hypothetical protein
VIAEKWIVSTSAVERVLSKVQLIVTTHRNRLNVTNNLLMVGINTNTRSDIDLEIVVTQFLSKRKRRIWYLNDSHEML